MYFHEIRNPRWWNGRRLLYAGLCGAGAQPGGPVRPAAQRGGGRCRAGRRWAGAHRARCLAGRGRRSGERRVRHRGAQPVRGLPAALARWRGVCGHDHGRPRRDARMWRAGGARSAGQGGALRGRGHHRRRQPGRQEDAAARGRRQGRFCTGIVLALRRLRPRGGRAAGRRRLAQALAQHLHQGHRGTGGGVPGNRPGHGPARAAVCRAAGHRRDTAAHADGVDGAHAHPALRAPPQ